MKRILQELMYIFRNSHGNTIRQRIGYIIKIILYRIKYHINIKDFISNQEQINSEDDLQHYLNKSLERYNYRKYWVKDFFKTRRFLNKYAAFKYETGTRLQIKRNLAYERYYKTGKDLIVEYNVIILRQHMLDGTISIGNNVLLGKNAFIDYSGHIIIKDNVALTHGCYIQTHSHTNWILNEDKKNVVSTNLIIDEGVVVGNQSIILETCHKIGRFAKIGSGTVIRKSIPPYAIVIGNPARIIGFSYTPSQMLEFETKHYSPEERTSFEEYQKLYDKYSVNRVKDNRDFLKL